jgi:hypothetical protein
LLLLMLFMGVAPRPFLNRSREAVEAVRVRVATPPTGGSFASIEERQHQQAQKN